MSSRTVLVVDDEDDIREIVQMTLEVTTSWDVLTANSGADAIDVAQAHHPDAVLMDVMMPGMDGLAAFERLQADDATRDIPVILLTAKMGVGATRPWDGYPVHGTIAKPFDPMTLGDEVARLLSWPGTS